MTLCAWFRAMIACAAAALLGSATAGVAAPAAPRAGAANAIANGMVEDLRKRMAEALCAAAQSMPSQLDEVLARRTDATGEAVAGYRARLAEAGPKLREACLVRAREALAAPEAPFGPMADTLTTQLAARLTKSELEQARAAAASSFGLKLADLRVEFEVGALPQLGP